MDTSLQTHLDNLHSMDRLIQRAAFFAVIETTNQPVDWAYQVWDGFVADLQHKDMHVRAIAAQVLANLAKSDPDSRILRDFASLMLMLKDKSFVAARHSLQSFWKIGVVGQTQQKHLTDTLTQRYHDCESEKNATLIRYDILECFQHIYQVTGDESLRDLALRLIELETDLKYRKKYSTLWRKK